jgi:AcrR family transcriptional regulator
VRADIARMLRQAAREYTAPEHPPGCMIISAAANCTDPEVSAALRAIRNANIADFEQRIAAAVAAGEEPADTDPAALARFAAAVLQGMSQQARDGARQEELEAVAEAAMRAWPGTA